MQWLIDLVSWILSPMDAPWSAPSESTNILRHIRDEIPGGIALGAAWLLATSHLDLEIPSTWYTSLLGALSPLFVVAIGFVIGETFTRDEARRVLLWLYRCFAINLALVTLWGGRLAIAGVKGENWYTNFYVATYISGIFLMTLCFLSLMATHNNNREVGVSIALKSVLLYLIALTIILWFGIPSPPAEEGIWWPMTA